jgi:hypothetical protein
MMMKGKRFYVYIDGESHYIRNEAKAKKLSGFTTLGKIQRAGQGHDVKARDDCHFFWDSEYLAPGMPIPDRMVYFTAFTGNDNGLHDANVYLRSLHFEPFIIKEEKNMRERRKTMLLDSDVIGGPHF